MRDNRQDIFFTDDDRRVYLELLVQQAGLFGLRLLGYCLMDNHIHAVAVPADEQGLAKTFGRTHYRYSQYINRSQDRSGHLWQNRFCSCALDQQHLWQTLAYVELNPVRARRVRQAGAYDWSSAAAHLGQQPAPAWLDQKLWIATWTASNWRQVLSHKQDQVLVGQIRLSTHRGRPLASDKFLAKLEARLNHRLRPLPVGRPRSKQEDAPPPQAQQTGEAGTDERTRRGNNR